VQELIDDLATVKAPAKAAPAKSSRNGPRAAAAKATAGKTTPARKGRR
jgi:hypothetical protein